MPPGPKRSAGSRCDLRARSGGRRPDDKKLAVGAGDRVASGRRTPGTGWSVPAEGNSRTRSLVPPSNTRYTAREATPHHGTGPVCAAGLMGWVSPRRDKDQQKATATMCELRISSGFQYEKNAALDGSWTRGTEWTPVRMRAPRGQGR